MSRPDWRGDLKRALSPSSEFWGLPLFLGLFAVTFTLLVFLVTIYESLGTNLIPFAAVFTFLLAIFWIIEPFLRERLPRVASSLVLIAIYLTASQVLILFSGGISSRFFITYYFVLFTAAMAHGLTGALFVTGLIAAAYSTFLESPLDFPLFLTNLMILWIIALMVGFLAETKRRVERREALQSMRLAALEQVAEFMRDLPKPDDVVEAGMEAAEKLLAADAVSFWEGERRLFSRPNLPMETGLPDVPVEHVFPVELDRRNQSFVVHRSTRLTGDERRIVRLLLEKMINVRTHLADRAALAAVRAEKERVLESIGTGVLTVTAAGEVRSANRKALETLGLSQQPLGNLVLTAPPFRFPPPASWGPEVREVEVGTADGDRIPIILRILPRLDDAGARAGWLVVFDDLREIRRLEADLRKTEALAALGEMSARVAHEIRNPLGGILGHLGLAERKANPEIRLHLTEAKTAVTRLESTIQDLLRFGRPPGEIRGSFALEETWEQVKRAEAARQEGNPSLAESVVEDIPRACSGARLQGDAGLFLDVIGNLLRNAREAIEGRGRVVLRAAIEPSFLRVEVDDDGPGIPPDTAGRIFEPFVSTKARGSGLGLPIARKIVEDVGGSMGHERVKGPFGEVTRFHVLWPLVAG